MSLWKIAWRSITQRGVASLLTGLSLALGTGLVTAVLLVFALVNDYFGRGVNLGYDYVVGADGGAQQLVLNSVYFLGKPVGNLPYSYYQEFTQGKYAEYVDFVLPCCLGDSYQGFKVVGVSHEHFDKLIHGRENENYRFAEGENFRPEEFFTGVVGWKVARETGLGAGDEFQPTHGVSEDGLKHDAFRVTGVLAPTGTPVDNGVFVNIEGFYLLEGHALPPSRADLAVADPDEHDGDEETRAGPDQGGEIVADDDAEHSHAGRNRGHEPLPLELREVTSLLVAVSDPGYSMSLASAINKQDDAQAVSPVMLITTMQETFVGPMEQLLLALAALVVVVAAVGVLVSMYNSMNERRREIAVMRALGAGRGAVTTIVLLEAVILAVGGGLAGMLLGHMILGALGPWLSSQTGAVVNFLQISPYELVLIPVLIVLAAVVGAAPAATAYRTDVSKVLSS